MIMNTMRCRESDPWGLRLLPRSPIASRQSWVIIAALQGVVALDDTSVCFIGRGCSRVRSADVGVEPRRTFI